MKRSLRKIIPLFAAVVLTSNVAAQDLHETLANVGADYGSQYVLPLSNSIGADLNAGLFHTARSGKGLFGVNVYVGIKVAGMIVDPTQQQFSMQFPTEVDYSVSFGGSQYDLRVPAEFSVSEAPTIFGDREAAVATARVRLDTTIFHQGNVVPISIDTTLTQELIGGIVRTRIAPLVIPHASFGSILGTDFSVRWLPTIEHASYGSISLKGGGIRHNVSRYVRSLPVDIAVTASWQQLNTEALAAGDFSIDIETVAYGIIVSKSLPLVTVYGGLQREQTVVDYAYEYSGDLNPMDEPVGVSFSHDASSRGRAVLGVTLNLGPLVTNFDYAVGNERVASAGIGFGF